MKLPSINDTEQAILNKEGGMGVIMGLARNKEHIESLHCHLYYGTFSEPEEPLCPYGYNDGKDGYSIFRGNVGRGICRLCLRKAHKHHVASVKALNESHQPTNITSE